MMIQLLTRFGAATDSCSSFLSFPTWYKYVHKAGDCSVIQINSLNDVWLIVAAVIEILLRVAGIAAVGFIVYAGIQYVTSQGDPDSTAKARVTIINALIGLVIALLASVIINFIAGSIK